MEFLLSRYMKAHPDVYKRMIVAYVVGYSITPQYLSQNPFLKFATSPDDTGVIVSWNTEAPTVKGTNPVILPGGLVINPITWTRTQTEATAAQNLGSIELNPATGGTPVLDKNGGIKRFMNLADARIDKAKGVVVCSTINAADPPTTLQAGSPRACCTPSTTRSTSSTSGRTPPTESSTSSPGSRVNVPAGHSLRSTR
jgi:hypothetical protein